MNDTSLAFFSLFLEARLVSNYVRLNCKFIGGCILPSLTVFGYFQAVSVSTIVVCFLIVLASVYSFSVKLTVFLNATFTYDFFWNG